MRVSRPALTVAALVLVAWVAAGAQQAAKLPRLGRLMPGHPGLASSQRVMEALQHGLRDLGWVEGQTIAFETRWDEGRPERWPELARDLVRRRVDVIFAGTTSGALAARDATRAVPIVAATLADPVRLGLGASLARPSGNVTGLTDQAGEGLVGKRLELLREAVPELSRLAIFLNPRPGSLRRADYEGAVRALDLRAQYFDLRDPTEFDGAFQAAVRGGARGVAFGTSPLFSQHAARLAELALKSRLPTMSGETRWAAAGGLMSYAHDRSDSFRRAARYIDRILRGARPEDLPFEQPTKFELVVNLRTAKALGLTIPPSVLLRADEVIE